MPERGALLTTIRVIDAITEWSGKTVAWMIVPLFLSLTYEGIARYVFNAPTLWAYDLSYMRSEEHTSELQSLRHLVCRLLLEKKNIQFDRVFIVVLINWQLVYSKVMKCKIADYAEICTKFV